MRGGRRGAILTSPVVNIDYLGVGLLLLIARAGFYQLNRAALISEIVVNCGPVDLGLLNLYGVNRPAN